jgi:uncharacterized protein YqgC (DUF456 family)
MIHMGLATIDIVPMAKWITIVMMGVGLLVIPILPGLMIIWATALGYGIVAGFGRSGWVIFTLITVLMLAGSILDNVLMGTKAHKAGAPWWVVLLSLVSAIVGSVVIPIPIIGGVLAALMVLFLIEWIRLKDHRKAFQSMKGMVIGCTWAVVFRVIIGLAMIGLWIFWAWA